MKSVIVFEYLNIVKSKSFLITNLIIAIFILMWAFIPNIITFFSNFSSGDGADIKHAAYIDNTDLYDTELLSAYFPNYEWVAYEASQLAEVKDAVRDRELEIGVHFTSQFSFDYITRSSGSNSEVSAIADMISTFYQINSLEEKNIDLREIEALMSVEVSANHVSVNDGSFFLGYFFLILTFIPLLMYASLISMSVVNEKTSKTVELLFTSADPQSIIFGKVLGVGLVLLTQTVFMILALLLSLALSPGGGNIAFTPDILLTLGDASLYIFILIFFLCGFIMYAFIYAGFASTVRDAQEASSANMLPSLLSIAGFYIGLFALQSEVGTTFVQVSSFMPFLSPAVMIARICTTFVPLHELLIATAINIATVVFAGVVSSRIYNACIMAYGTKFTLKMLFAHATKR